MKRSSQLFVASFLALAALWTGPDSANAATILVDQAHGQRFMIGETGPLHLSGLAALLREQGIQVAPQTEPLSDKSLATADALVLSGPFAPYTPAEVDAITRFVERGGRLAVMLHIGPPLADLLHRLGVDFTNSVVRERENLIGGDPLNFQVTRFEQHPITQELHHFSLYGGWALVNFSENGVIIARTGPNSWVDLDGDRKVSEGDAVQSFGVVVAGKRGNGRFVVFGDDAIFQNKFLDADNMHLARNLANWLK